MDLGSSYAFRLVGNQAPQRSLDIRECRAAHRGGISREHAGDLVFVEI